ncbi:MAG: mechanosensitive ion channel [Candidatus Altiarchaeales archaeon]|nr:mechanosensitive ion channel [Candidatus Altiarchaeales archaeon]
MNLETVFNFFLPYLPNLLWIILIIAATRLALGSTGQLLFLIHKHLNIPRRYYLTVRALLHAAIYVFAFILILVFTPGVNQHVIALLGIGIGVVVSLSSTTTIGNAVAGIIIYLTRPIHEGDRVEITGVLGDVVNLELMYVHLKTIKDEIVSIPSLQVLNNKIINYSQLDSTIIYVRLSLGYDIEPRQVEELLIKSALETEGILKDPKPFILIRGLDNFTVTYELNAYTDKPQSMVDLKSSMRRNILNTFACDRVQIMSPTYVNIKERMGVDKIIPEHISSYFEKQCVSEEERKVLEDKVAEAKKKLEEKKKKDIKLDEK